MGQYHLIANLDKKQYLHPHRFGDGLKLMEFGCSSPGTMTALAVLLAPQSAEGGRGGGDFHHDVEGIVGSWAGDRIAIVGDYAEEGDKEGWDAENDQTLYATMSGWIGDNEVATGWVELSPVLLPLLRKDSYVDEQLSGRYGLK
jgi:hypothetical protein